MQRYTYTIQEQCPLQVYKEEFTSGFWFLSAASLPTLLSVIEKVVEDAGILRIYRYILTISWQYST